MEHSFHDAFVTSITPNSKPSPTFSLSTPMQPPLFEHTPKHSDICNIESMIVSYLNQIPRNDVTDRALENLGLKQDILAINLRYFGEYLGNYARVLGWTHDTSRSIHRCCCRRLRS